jgi:hypothetical protein
MAGAVLTPRYKDLKIATWTRAAPLTTGIIRFAVVMKSGKFKGRLQIPHQRTSEQRNRGVGVQRLPRRFIHGRAAYAWRSGADKSLGTPRARQYPTGSLVDQKMAGPQDWRA